MAAAAAVVITAAAVVAAGMTCTMLIVVVIAPDIGVKAQIAGQVIGNRGICITAAAAVELNARLCQRHLGTAADTAADQHIDVSACQKTCQRTVTAAVGVDHFRCDDLTVLNFVNLELLGVTEVLEDSTVGISYCNFHNMSRSFC